MFLFPNIFIFTHFTLNLGTSSNSDSHFSSWVTRKKGDKDQKDDDDKTIHHALHPHSSSPLRQPARSETNFNVTRLRPTELNHQSVGRKKQVLSKFEVDAILMIKPDMFLCWRWWVWNFWLRTWRSTLCGYGMIRPSMVQVCHNAKSYASAKGSGPDFFWCCNFQFHSGIP